MTEGSNDWQPPSAPDDGVDPVIAVDPRVNADHVIGVLPCPSNPPPPSGWAYWAEHVAPDEATFAATILHDPAQYPMGAFVQAVIGGRLVGARVEWHTLQGATGKTGCFRGVNLMSPRAP
jgi:hypothetical protein